MRIQQRFFCITIDEIIFSLEGCMKRKNRFSLKVFFILILIFCGSFYLFFRISQNKSILPFSQKEIPDKRGRETSCFLHKETLLDGIARVSYGLLLEDDPSLHIQNTKFPNANLFFHVGCSPKNYEEVQVRYCKSCRQAQHQFQTNSHRPN